MARSKTEKVAALAALEVGVTTGEAAKLTGIPQRTIQAWRAQGRTDPELAQLVEEAATNGRQELIVKAASIVSSVASIVDARLKALEGDPAQVAALTPSGMQSLSVTGGIWADKLQAFTTKGDYQTPPPAPEISRHQDVIDLLPTTQPRVSPEGTKAGVEAATAGAGTRLHVSNPAVQTGSEAEVVGTDLGTVRAAGSLLFGRHI